MTRYFQNESGRTLALFVSDTGTIQIIDDEGEWYLFDNIAEAIGSLIISGYQEF